MHDPLPFPFILGPLHHILALGTICLHISLLVRGMDECGYLIALARSFLLLIEGYIKVTQLGVIPVPYMMHSPRLMHLHIFITLVHTLHQFSLQVHTWHSFLLQVHTLH